MPDVGDLVPITFTVRTAAGALTNAATVTLTITLPDGTTVTPPVTNPPAATGIYTYDYPTVQVGRHTWRATTTVPTAAYGPLTFHVAEASPGPIIGLDDAKRHLNMDLTTTTHDEELRGFLEAATPVVEDVVGPVVVRTYREVHSSGALLVLGQAPVVSLTTLTPVLTGGSSYTVAALDVDAETGIVRRLDGGSFTGPVRVTYKAGRAIVPANIVQATAEIVRPMWETQRGHSGARPGFGEEDLLPTSSGFTVPRRAMELLKPHQKAPMVA